MQIYWFYFVLIFLKFFKLVLLIFLILYGIMYETGEIYDKNQ